MNQKIDYLQAVAITAFTSVAAYFDSTITYLIALLIAFAFNIFAGFKADEVKVILQRIFPPIIFKNFHGNKLKDSLIELALIASVTYLLKSIADLMKYKNQSDYIVQFLIAIAIYHYLRNGLRNLKSVYPKHKFIAVVYFLLSFKFREMFGNQVADMMDEDDVKGKEVANETR